MEFQWSKWRSSYLGWVIWSYALRMYAITLAGIEFGSPPWLVEVPRSCFYSFCNLNLGAWHHVIRLVTSLYGSMCLHILCLVIPGPAFEHKPCMNLSTYISMIQTIIHMYTLLCSSRGCIKEGSTRSHHQVAQTPPVDGHLRMARFCHRNRRPPMVTADEHMCAEERTYQTDSDGEKIAGM